MGIQTIQINEWKPIQDVDFSDENIKQYHIDTRDFRCIMEVNGFGNDSEDKFDYDIIKKYPQRFFHSNEKVKEIIDRYYTESGGEKKYRNFMLEGIENWNLKYIRIYRTELGLCICNRFNKALKLSTLMFKVKINPYS